MKKLIKKWQEDAVYNYLCKKAKGKPFSNEFYNSLTTEFAGTCCGEKLKTENTSGQCYFYSLLLSKSLPNSTLIIGALNNLNSNVRNEYMDIFGHGWVEKDGLVYDTSCKQVFNRDCYYKIFDASVKEQYTADELNDTHLFFKLGINAVKDRANLVKQLYEIVEKNLNLIYSNLENIKQSLKVVYDSSVITELDKYFSLPVKNR